LATIVRSFGAMKTSLGHPHPMSGMGRNLNAKRLPQPFPGIAAGCTVGLVGRAGAVSAPRMMRCGYAPNRRRFTSARSISCSVVVKRTWACCALRWNATMLRARTCR
jgi:hypothetical protein